MTPDRRRSPPQPHLVAPPGLRRGRRPPVAQRRGPRGPGPRARHAAVRLRPRPAAREHARAPGGALPRRCPVRDPLRAQGLPGPADPRGAARDGRTRDARERRDRRLLPGRGHPRPRQRLGAVRDQPHRHQRVRAGPGRAPRPADPDQPRRRQPGRAAGAPGAGADRSASGSTRAPGPATRSTSRTPASGRPSSGSPRTAWTTRSPPSAATG